MDNNTFRKFCPVCHLDNDADATVCQYCQSPLTPGVSGAPTTRRVDMSSELADELIDQIMKKHPPAPEGLSLFLLNNGQPVDLCLAPEFTLGRADDAMTDPMVDLTKLEAFSMGVSRRHAIIKAVDDKYELIDINSSNGTWLNGNRLMPNKPHDLPSGSVIQLGRLKLVVIYQHPPAAKNT